MNTYKKYPDDIICNKQFILYKSREQMANDINITNEYFEEPDANGLSEYTYKIDFTHDYQFSDFKKLNYNLLTPIIDRYFKPNENINQLVQ